MTTPPPLPTAKTKLEELFPTFMERDLNDFRGRSLWRNNICKEFEVQDENFRHFCKICKRRFACGRALGGHMRIHGAAAEKSKAITVQKKEEEEEEKSSQDRILDKNYSASPMYALRANRKPSWILEDKSYAFLTPDADRSISLGDSGACDLCGREFSSLKAMLQHIRCDHGHSQFSPDEFRSDSESLQNEQILDIETHKNTKITRLPKGKRTKRLRTPEDPQNHQHENSPTTSVSQYNEEEDMAKCLVMLSSVGGPNNQLQGKNNKKKKSKICLGLGREVNVDHGQLCEKSHYNCKTCGKVFSSFQALGGHRASHKNLKGCSSKARPDGNDSSEEEIVTTDEDFLKAEADYLNKCAETQKLNKEESMYGKPRLHECSICHRNFPSGQALGGHKRCHWTNGEASITAAGSCSLQKTDEEKIRPHGGKLLDLNLPAPADDEESYGHFEIEKSAEPKNMVKNLFVDYRTEYPYHVQPWRNGKSEKGRFSSSHDQTHIDDEAESKQKEYG